MKFLCRNCKAKYQIADEKVAGRTLRMTCQQCGEPIVVRGAARQPAAIGGRPMAPAALGAQPSALGADFQRQLSIPAGALSAPVHEEWHVAINDVPVGPMRRDEVARKIAMGAVDRESLAWREGMDDWLAIKHIAELAVLFPTTGPAKVVTGSLAAPPPSAAGRISASAAPAARTDMAPIGGRQVVAVEVYDPAPAAEVALASIAPEPAPVAFASPIAATHAAAAHAPAAAPLSPPAPARQFAWGPMVLIAGAIAFCIAIGAVIGVRMLAPPAAPATPAQQAVAAAPEQPPAAASQPAPQPQSNVIELDMQAIDGTSASPRRSSGSSAASGSQIASADKKTASGPAKQLTAEQKEMLERMGGGLNQGPSNIRSSADSSRGSGSQAGSLTAEQLSSVVNNGRKNLQRCYETALRGSNSQETVRLDVEIQVSPSGNVTSVHTGGKGLPGMEDCITRTVRMWRFPMSGEATQTRFPVVFQPGA